MTYPPKRIGDGAVGFVNPIIASVPLKQYSLYQFTDMPCRFLCTILFSPRGTIGSTYECVMAYIGQEIRLWSAVRDLVYSIDPNLSFYLTVSFSWLARAVL
jgi:hypothetical protein